MFMYQKTIEILSDYPAFYARQSQQLQELGIEIDGLEVSHQAFRTVTTLRSIEKFWLHDSLSKT